MNTIAKQANLDLFQAAPENQHLVDMQCSGVALVCAFCEHSDSNDVGLFYAQSNGGSVVGSCSKKECLEKKDKAIHIKRVAKIQLSLKNEGQTVSVLRGSGAVEEGYTPYEIGYNYSTQRYLIKCFRKSETESVTKPVYMDECCLLNKDTFLMLAYNPFVTREMVDDMNSCAGRENFISILSPPVCC
jgi:hypothetical protein